MQDFATLEHSGQVRRLKGLAAAALTHYAFPAGVHLVPLAHEENTTFRADAVDGARYALRITRPGKNTLAEVQSEMAWLAALRRETGLGVPEPVPARNGELTVVAAGVGVPEPRVCVLFRWVDGRFLNAGLTPRHLVRVGAFTARLHEHASGFIPPAGFQRWQMDRLDAAWEAEALGKLAAARPPEDVAALQAVIAHIRARVAPLGQEPDAYGLIHSDLHQWNYLFQRGEVRAIDFDDCGYGHYAYDLATTLGELQDRPNYDQLRAALLAGYRTVRPLPAAAEAALPALIMRRWINILLWQVDLRDHPAFRERWAAGVTADLAGLRAAMSA